MQIDSIYSDAMSRAAISETITGITYTSATGVFSMTAGYVIPTTTEEANWNAVYANNHVAATIADTSSLNLSITGQEISGVVLPAGVAHDSLAGVHQAVGTGASPVFAGASISDLTAGRVVYAGTSGDLSDDADLTWSTTTNTLTSANVFTPAETLGDELVVHGTFADSTGWTLGAGWSEGDEAAAFDGSGGTGTLTQAVPVVAGKLYKFSYAFSPSIGGFTPTIGGFTGTARVDTDPETTYTEYFVASSTATLTFTPAGASSVFGVDNVSVTEVVKGIVSGADVIAGSLYGTNLTVGKIPYANVGKKLTSSSLRAAGNDVWLSNVGTQNIVPTIGINAGSAAFFAEATAGGAYLSMYGVTESAMNWKTSGNTAGLRLCRWINLSDNLRVDLLNDAGTTIVTTGIFSCSLDAPANSFVIQADGDIAIAENLYLVDSKKIYLGTGSDLQLYHDGTNSYIYNDTGVLKIQDAGTGIQLGTASTQLLGFYGATAVDRPDTVADPSGGLVIDTECRTAVGAVIDRLQELGLIT